MPRSCCPFQREPESSESKQVDPDASQNAEFSRLIGQHAGILWKVAYAWSRQPADREDLVQEMALQLWRAFPRFDSKRSFSTWMYRIALNVAIASERRRKRRVPVQSIEAHAIEPVAPVPDLGLEHRMGVLFAVMDRFDSEDRALLLLWLEGLAYAQIADVIGISESNVGTRLNRLKSRIQSEIKTASPNESTLNQTR
jgi:RNA polymerase sigma-70 factor, ECF subfamily